MNNDILKLIARAESVLQRLENVLPQAMPVADFDKHFAFRWRKKNGRGFLQPVLHPHKISFRDLIDVTEQRKRLEANTRQFVDGKPANNVLLTGSRGTGKSSMVKAAFNQFCKKGLRLIEVDKADLVDLADIVDLIENQKQRFIIYCDDLSFEANEPGYKSLKVVLDGSIAAASENILIYATSNRRHLMPEKMSENNEAVHTADGEIHPGETTEEKISLSERFGLCLTFYPFDQEQYLAVVAHWVAVLSNDKSFDAEAMRRAALLWTLEHDSRSGRVAYQFARDWVGRH